MRDVSLLRQACPPRRALFGALLLFAACGPVDDDDTTAPEDPWTAEQIDLPGAALSIWGVDSDDVWVAGTGGTTDAPMLLHRSDGTWNQLDTGETGEAWWVVGDGDESIWLVGNEGLILRYDRADDAFTRIATATPATLFGAWVAPSGTLYAVGGTVNSSTDGPVLFRVDGDVATEVTDLPNGVSDNESFFKVWGSDDDDVWVISDMGTVLHFDGADWSLLVLPDNPRLVTVHGSGPEDIVIVGGLSGPTIFERDGLAWDDVSPSAGQPLNGVFVTAGGAGFAAGFGNHLMERTGGVWSRTEGSLVLTADWHGVWIDETGAPWIVGGDLIGLEDGLVIRRDEP